MGNWFKSKHGEPNARQADLDDDSENHDSKLLKALYSWVMVLLGLSILLVIQNSYFQDVHKHIGIFIEELAFALILAGLFSLTVEKYHREEFRKFVLVERRKLKRDVFLYAYGHAIHDQTRQEMRQQILDCPFYRDQLRLEWHLSPCKEAANKIRVRKTISYVQKNGTNLPQKYHYKLHQGIASSVLAEVSQDQSQLVKIRRRNKPDIQLGEGAVKPKDIHPLETDDVGELQPGEEMEVSFTISEIRVDTDNDVYSSRHPIVGLTTVSVHVEGGLKLTASAYCRAEALEQRTEFNENSDYSWQIRTGILPFQGITVSWASIADSEKGESEVKPTVNTTIATADIVNPPISP